MKQKKSNKVKEYLANISGSINKYIHDTKASIDIRGLIILFVFSLVLAASFFFHISFTSYLLIKILFSYFVLAFLFSSIVLLISIILRTIKKEEKTFFDKIFYVLIWILLFLFIPIFAVIKVVGFIVSLRAKKMDNIEIILFIFIIDLIILQNLLGVGSVAITAISDFIRNISLRLISMNIEIFPLEFLLVLCFFKGVADLTNFILLVALRGYGVIQIKKSVKDQKKLQTYDFKPEDDISEHLDNLQKYEENQKDELSYDLLYFRKALLRPQLFILVILFIIVALAPTYLSLDEYQSDAINVITIFTLIMLLIDKNKDWDEELEKLSNKMSDKITIKTSDKEEKPKIILEN